MSADTGRDAAKEADWRIPVASLAEVRSNIDRLDTIITKLLCERLYFVNQAANFKPSVAGVVVPARVEEIVNRVREMTKGHGSNPDTIEAVYRAIIDAFTRDEQQHWRDMHGGAEK